MANGKSPAEVPPGFSFLPSVPQQKLHSASTLHHNLRMPGRALLLTADKYLEEVVRGIGREVAMQVACYVTMETAAQACAQSTFDLVVVDCDDVHNGSSFLRHLRRGWSTRNAAVIAIVNGGTSPFDAADMGADTTLENARQQPSPGLRCLPSAALWMRANMRVSPSRRRFG